MNQIAQAFAEAGVRRNPIPANQRAWQWIHDHPNHTGKEISAATGIVYTNLTSLITDLRNRGMLNQKREWDVREKRELVRYSVVGHEYVLLPRKTPKGKPKGSTSSSTPVVSAIHSNGATAPPSAFNCAAICDDLTLRQLRELHGHIGKLLRV